MTIFKALRSIVCGGLWRRGESDGGIGATRHETQGVNRLNGEKEKLRQLCSTIDGMKVDMEKAQEQLNVIVSTIREAPEDEGDRCSGCVLAKMQRRLKKPRRSRNRG